MPMALVSQPVGLKSWTVTLKGSRRASDPRDFGLVWPDQASGRNASIAGSLSLPR